MLNAQRRYLLAPCPFGCSRLTLMSDPVQYNVCEPHRDAHEAASDAYEAEMQARAVAAGRPASWWPNLVP